MSAPVNLSSIAAGTGGFVIYGQDVEDQSGWSIASAGDVNGDGFDDILIGARFGSAAGNAKVSAGDSYLVFGKASGFVAVDLLAVAQGTGGFVIHGQDGGDKLGTSVSSAGDINGDGFADLLIGAPYGDAAANGKVDAGESYVFFGKSSGFAASVDLTSVAGGSGGFVIHGQDLADYSGWSVASAGDINGDGFDDLLIGARGGDASANGKSQAGDSYVVFGKASGFGASVELTSIATGNGGFVIHGQDANDVAGWSVASAGDVNGDGFDDLIIGTRAGDGAVPTTLTNAGDSYVVFGKASGFGASVDLAAVAAGTGGFVIWGADAFDYSGTSVSSAGDINGDGFDDLVIGAHQGDGAGNGKVDAGEAYVVFGKSTSFGAVVNLTTIAAGTGGFVIYGQDLQDNAGYSVASAGDVNGDGFDDLLIGVRGGDGASNTLIDAGESYVIFGKAGGFGASIDLATIAAGTGGFVIYGEDTTDSAGAAVAAGGDINGDGFDDLLIGARNADAAGNLKNDAGDSYVIFGKDFTTTVTHQGTSAAEFLTGSANADIMIGGLGNDTLSGGDGADALRGGAGDDSLAGGAGADRLDGGLGRDTASYGLSPTAVTINLATSLISGGDASGDIYGSIENLTGSAFNDSLTGDAQANLLSGNAGVDTLTGGAGNDTLVGGAGNDTLSGGAGTDTAVFSGLRSSYTITKSAGSVTVNGADGVDVLTGVEKLSFNDATINLAKPATADFNADGNSDLLWLRQSDGQAYLWTLSNNVQSGGGLLGQVGAAWTIQTTGDFNGDGSADFIWKNTTTGQFYIWNFNNGVQSGSANLGNIGTNWNVMGSGDFNADGTGDIVWRDSNTGQLYLWMMQNNAISSSTDLGAIGVNWTVQAVGDFNGNGTSDLALRNTVTGQAYLWNFTNGTLSGGSNLGNVATNYTIMGSGDFNADGTDDLAWRNSSNGNLNLWMMQNNSISSTSDLGTIGAQWTIDAISDVNADGSSDLLLKNTSSGQFYIWDITNGVVSGGADLGVIGADWQLV